MKKLEIIYLVIILFIFLFLFSLINEITSRAVFDAKAVSDTASVSIKVVSPTKEALGVYSPAKPTIIPLPIPKPGKLFDVKIRIPERYKTLIQGKNLVAEITITNIQKIGLVKVKINYIIKNIKNNTIFYEYETKAIEKSISYIKEIDTSKLEPLEPGEYKFIITVIYKTDLAIDWDTFRILKKPHIEIPSPMIKIKTSQIIISIIVMLAIIFGAILYYMLHKHKQSKKL